MGNFLVASESVPFVILLGALTALFWFIDLGILSAVFALLMMWVLWFFRNPLRRIPDGVSTIVSPADGKVMEIVEENEIPFSGGTGTRISIFLNIFDVHINRIPFAGKVIETGFISGKYLAAMKPMASKENHRHAVRIRTFTGKEILVVQIVGFIARRIRCWVNVGDDVLRGDRFGLIQFGSRVDTFLPSDVRLSVQVGDYVKGGTSILGEFNES